MLTSLDVLSDILDMMGFFLLLMWGLLLHATFTYNGEDAHNLMLLYGWIPAAAWFTFGYAAWRAHVRLSLKRGLPRPLYGGGFAQPAH